MAAGESRRTGNQKLLLPFGGKALIEHAIDAAGEWDPVVVCSPEVARFLTGHPDVRVVTNDRPELGMSHSLALADAAIPGHLPILVLLGDKPRAGAALIRRLCAAAGGADVAFPVRGEEPGHPVYLSPRARARIRSLPPGDTIRMLRDDPELVRRAIPESDCGAYFDVDTLADMES